MCFIRICEQTATFTLYNINRLFVNNQGGECLLSGMHWIHLKRICFVIKRLTLFSLLCRGSLIYSVSNTVYRQQPMLDISRRKICLCHTITFCYILATCFGPSWPSSGLNIDTSSHASFSVNAKATGWTIWGSNLGEGKRRFFVTERFWPLPGPT